MDDFVAISLDVVEFPSTIEDKQWKLKDAACESQPPPLMKSMSTQWNESHDIGIQTESFRPNRQSHSDQHLAQWLKKIYPIIEAELLEGVTQMYSLSLASSVNISLVPYQTIVQDKVSKESYSRGTAAWLSTRLDNVPDLVLSSSPPHQGWCNHLDQKISLFRPKRMQPQQFIAFTEVHSLPVKACIQYLSANIFNKNMFAGITVACDFHVWEYDSSNNLDEIKEIAYTAIQYASIVGIDWLQVNEVLTAHSDGFICLWTISKEIILSKRFKVDCKSAVTTILSVSTANFAVGTQDGRLYYCSTVQTAFSAKHADTLEPYTFELEKHTFGVIYLAKGNFNGTDVIISYDLSGELFLHDLRNSEDGPLLLIKMPLPFKNSIVCSKNVEYAISPGIEGKLELFRIRDGQRTFVKGSLTEKDTLVTLSDNGVLLFPPVNNYRRFLIHKVCEGIATQYDLVTFSVGQGINRRTVVCYRKQLLLPLEDLSGEKKKKEEKKEEKERYSYTHKSWRSGCASEPTSRKSTSQKMGVDKGVPEGSNRHSKTVDIYRPPALRNTQPSNSSILKGGGDSGAAESSTKSQPQNNDNHVTETKVQSNLNQTERPVRRERRPDRAVYVPRARRSQTTSPHSNPSKTKANEMLPSTRHAGIVHKESGKNSQPLDSNLSDNLSQTLKERVPVISNNCDSKFDEKSKESYERSTIAKVPNNNVSTENCDNSIQQNVHVVDSTNVKNLNSNETNNINLNPTKKSGNSREIPLIENAALPKKDSEDDKEINELERMSKEINRSSRRIIKQTFNSDVLQIPDTILPIHSQPGVSDRSKDVDPETDDWDSMFDDNGDCLDPKILSELTASVGKVKIEQPKADYKAYLMKQAILNEEEYPHVLEVSNFPVEFKTQDLMMVFSTYKESGFDIKWVDDTHALAVFSSSRIAAEVLAMGHPFVLLKPLADATVESRTKARKCAASLQPYRPRPETCAALARRLVTGALGVRLKTAAEERENEKKVLREAKERKLLAAKQREEAWES